MKRFGILLTLAALLSMATVGCRQLTPEEKVASLRSQYSAEAMSFIVVEPEETTVDEEQLPDAEEAVDGEDVPEQVDVETDTETDIGEIDEPVEPVTGPVTVLVDVLVSTTATETLDGLTLDVFHADAQQDVKENRRVWIDTSGVVRGPGTQFTIELEDVDYEEGDGFSVEVRSPVPEAERSEYREFQEAG
jgi:hypothetical protein